ncbi:MAG: hypothetical protein ACXWQO_18755 [Bdellovibrionota bacterium]
MLLLFLCGHLAHAANEEKLAEADNFYRAGDWSKALSAYTEVLTSSDAEKLPSAFYYNLGTASARTGANGIAYTYLLKALAGQPWDSDTLHNLKMVEAKLSPSARAIQPSTWISAWPLSAHFFRASFWLLPILLCGAPLLWAAGSGKNRARLLGFSALFIAALALSIAGYTQSRGAVSAFVKTGQVKSGPGPSYSNLVSLEPGSLVNAEDFRDGWVKIRFTGADLQETVGWIEAGALLPLH